MNKRALYRFARYYLVGGSTFLIDLVILYALTIFFNVPYQLAVGIGFAIGVSINYAVSRLWVFTGTERRLHHGYAYFLGAGLLSLAAVLTLVGILVERFGISLIVARILVSGVVGIGNYLFNLYLNFKVAGKHVH